jgi:hypothetical protein
MPPKPRGAHPLTAAERARDRRRRDRQCLVDVVAALAMIADWSTEEDVRRMAREAANRIREQKTWLTMPNT